MDDERSEISRRRCHLLGRSARVVERLFIEFSESLGGAGGGGLVHLTQYGTAFDGSPTRRSGAIDHGSYERPMDEQCGTSSLMLMKKF